MLNISLYLFAWRFAGATAEATLFHVLLKVPFRLEQGCANYSRYGPHYPLPEHSVWNILPRTLLTKALQALYCLSKLNNFSTSANF